MREEGGHAQRGVTGQHAQHGLQAGLVLVAAVDDPAQFLGGLLLRDLALPLL